MIIILTIVVIGLLLVLGNLLKKYETLETQFEQSEQRLAETYSAISVTLHTMRALDERRMFEDDDEVGVVFQELVTIVNNLRPFIYETLNEATTPDSKEQDVFFE